MPGFPEAPPVVPPVLSTPDTNIFDASTPPSQQGLRRRSDEELTIVYEIQRTVQEIRGGQWGRIALQFPDSMLPDAPRVFDMLRNGLRDTRRALGQETRLDDHAQDNGKGISSEKNRKEERLYILADTSYGACCVDEIAAEHVDADVVVHYGRACLSPTVRLPVIHVFTTQPLDVTALVGAFKATYPDPEEKIILLADLTYASHLPRISSAIKDEGYTNVYTTSIIHDPHSPLPNRTIPEVARSDPSALRRFHLFHISDPPPALLLTLASRVASFRIYPTGSPSPTPVLKNLTAPLRRRYALLTSLSRAAIIGILINTLSVSQHLSLLELLKALIARAGKKSYTVVVGKVNPAKLANFAEVEGWVVAGCWESSLLDERDGKGEYWRPVVTPWELELALKGDEQRIWAGDWKGDWKDLLDEMVDNPQEGEVHGRGDEHNTPDGADDDDIDSEEESEPPEFDLRTGRYIANTRPMRTPRASIGNHKLGNDPAGILIKRAKGDLALINGEASPGAAFMREKRTWRGLGSDFVIAYDEPGSETGTVIEEGRRGVARGYADEQGHE